jgi:hypothetical protein
VIVPLTWFTLIISILVCLIVAIVLWAGMRRASSSGGAAQFDVPAWPMVYDISMGVRRDDTGLRTGLRLMRCSAAITCPYHWTERLRPVGSRIRRSCNL